MEERYIYYNVDGKRYKVPESERSEFEKRAPNAKMSLTYEGKNYSVPLSEINDFVGKIGGTDGITYSSFDENKNYSAKSSTSSFSYLTEPDGNNAVSFEEPAMATNDVVEAKEEKKDTVGNFLQKLGQSYSSGYVKPENYSGVKVSNESTGKVDKVFADAAINSHEEHKKQIDKEIAKIDEEYYANKANEPKKSFWRKVLELPLTAQENAMEYDDAYSLQETKENREKGKDYTDALIAKNISEKVDKKVDQYQDPAKTFVGGVFQGIGDAVFDMDTWDQSIGLEQAARVKQITEKLEKGQSLTKGEQMIVDALVNDLATDALAATFGRGYKAGKVTGESLPFMLETALNPASGLGEAITKKFGKKILGSVLGKAGLYATRLLSDVAGAGIMAATTSAPRVAADAMNRLSGEVDFTIDDDGALQFNGFVGGEDSEWKAFGKAFGSNAIEHFSEMVGNYFGPLGHRAGRWTKGQAAKAADAFGWNTIAKNIRTATPNGFGTMFNDFLKQTQWNGVIGEFSEEIIGGILNAWIVGDQKLSKYDENGKLNENYLFNKDNLLDTFLGVSILGGAISGIKTLGYTTADTKFNRAIGDAKKNLEGHVTSEEMQVLEAFANNPFGVDFANLEQFNSKSKEDKEAIGKYLSAVMQKQGYMMSKEAQLSGTQQGLDEMKAAYKLGQNMTEADLYDINQAETEAMQALINTNIIEADGNEAGILPADVLSYSSYELFNLANDEKNNLFNNERQIIKNLAIARNAAEGLSDKLMQTANAAVQAHNAISTGAANNGVLTKANYDGTIYYVKGDVKVANGSIVRPSDVSGHPVEIVNSMTGESMSVDSRELTNVESINVDAYNADMANTIASGFMSKWENFKNTKSVRAKLSEVQQMVGEKIFIGTPNSTMTEVEIQQILPNGEVLLKGKKGDLGGQTHVRVDVDSFYDSISRDQEGNIMFADRSQFRSQTENIKNAKPDRSDYEKKSSTTPQQTAQPVAPETTTTEDVQPEPVVETAPVVEETEPEIEDFNEMEVEIMVNGIPVMVEVTNQDDAANKITYRYRDENNNLKIGGSTISDFRKSIQEAKDFRKKHNDEQVDTDVTPIVDTVEEVTTETPVTENTDVNLEPEAINWDELFERDKDAYLAELQNQFGEDAVDMLNGVIEATQQELDSLNKNKGKTQNEIFENIKRKKELQGKIDTLNGMVQKLTAVPEVAEEVTEAPVEEVEEPVTDVAPEAETTAEEEVTTEEPVTEEEPVVETQPEPVNETPAPVAPNPVPNPIAAAKDREAKLLLLLNRNAVSDELKADAAKRAGKEVADMFATYEEYEDYEAEAADLGEFVDFFNEGVKESFENRKNQNNSGNSQGNSVTLEEPKTENNGEQTGQTEAPETAPRQGDNSVGGRTNDGAKEGVDKTSEGGEQGQRESESENDKAKPLAYDYPARKGNATGKKLVDTFGFSNVTIPDSRKDILNTIYDFMMEMSKMLGISPKSIGQGGWLGVDNLRGNSSNSATYQFSNKHDGTVVNPRLKLKYARLSSIAHEWWHSLDHVLSFFETGKGMILTTMSNPYIFTGRKETYNAVKNVIDAIKKSGFESRMENLNVPRSYKNYLTKYEEMAARAFDTYINDKFAEAGIVVEGSVYNNNPYQPTAEEMAVIAPAFDNLFKVLKEKEGKTAGTSVLFHIGEEMEEGSEAWRLATEAVLQALDNSGIDVTRVTDEQTAEMLRIKEELSNPSLELMTAFHGSRYKFDKFDHSNMGKGEGAQAHGWGTYVAKDKQVGVDYAHTLRGTPKILRNGLDVTSNVRNSLGWAKTPLEVVATAIDWYGIDRGKAQIANELKIAESILESEPVIFSDKYQEKIDLYKNALSIINSGSWELKEAPTNLYTVEIPEDNGSNYFYEDGVTDSQMKKLSDICEKEGVDFVEVAVVASEFGEYKDGDRLYKALTQILGSQKATSELLSKAGFVGIKYDGRIDGECYVIFNEADAKITGHAEFYETEDGTVYGWTDGKNVYLTKAGLNPNTPIHEYTHLWARAMMQKNPNGWNSVKNLLKGTDIWNEVVNDPNYKSIQNDEDAVASEALSRVSGAKNAAKLEQMAQKMLDEANGTMRKAEARGLIQNIKDALNQFWSWVSKNLFEIENFGSVEEVTDRVLWDLMNETDLGELSEGQVETQIVTDPKVIAELEASPKQAGYRNVVQNEDGTFSSPMAYWLQHTKQGAKSRVETDKFELGKWEEAKEHPELVDENGHVTLVKPNKKTVSPVAYDPYIHNRLEPVNLQFKEAWKRSDLVYVETEVAEIDFNSGYHADKAKLPVGIHSWSNGAVMLSKYDKPVRVMSWGEVADAWAKRLNGEGVEFDVVPAPMRTLLIERGVDILPPHKNSGKDCEDAYKAWKNDSDSDALLFRKKMIKDFSDMTEEELYDFLDEYEGQYSSYSTDGNAYHNYLKEPNKDIIEAIKKSIISNGIDEVGRNVVFVGDYAYLVDHLKSSELSQDPNGIGIIRKVNVSGVENSAKHLIKESIYAGRVRNRRDVNQWIGAYRAKRELYNRYFGSVEDAEAALVDGRLDWRELRERLLSRNAGSVAQGWLSPKTGEKSSSNSADIQNAAVDYLVGEARNAAIENAVNEEASKLEVKVTYKTREQMPEGHENDKGYYNTKTGEIVVCTENASSIADAIQTILHESVAHNGLRQLMGDKFNEFINRVYNSLDAETKAKVDALATEHYDGNTAVATEEYMATLAESENFADNSVWDKIKSIFEDIINAILGRNDIKIGDNELRYILRASYNNMVNKRGMKTVRGWAQDQMMREEYKINQAETPEILSRTGVDPTDVAKETAKTVYDRVVNSSWNEFQRQFQDAYQPVRVAIDAIQAETGNIPIEDYENYLLIQNQSSSRSRVEIDTFQRRYYSPIIEQVNKIIDTILEAREFKKGDKTKRAEAYKEVLNYLIAKHGLERNEYYQTHKTRPITAAEMKPELDAAKKEYNEKILAVNENTVFSDAERELAKRDAIDEYNAAVTEIKTRQVPDMRDYSGLTSLYGMEPSEFEAAEAEARMEVEKFEKMFEGEVVIESLWKKINAATNKTLKHSYESGMISRQQYEDIKSMFNFYIPLRGFSEETAEDVYSYARFEGNRFNPAVYKAQGRTSVADDPIAIIMNMAESEIAQGNKNRAKQALYNYLLNRASGNMGQNSLMNVEDVWYYVSTDENGETVYTIAAPDHANGETYEAFENKMQALAEDGKAEKSKKGKVDIGKRFQKKQNEDSHYVYLKINGVDKAIYINGDPKAAEAINARNNKQPNWFTDKMRSLNRALSSTFTNYSIGFTARNYFRDLIYARIAVDVKEKGAEYKLKFRKNWYVGNVAVMMKMLSDYRNGKYDNGNLSELQAAFVDFMNNGGQTGYTLINSVENHKAELERAIARMQTGVDKGGIKDIVVIGHLLKGVEFLNEAMELRTRFTAFKTSRDLGRGINTAINDAKEITVNFNTKGAQDGTGVWGGLASYFGWSKYFFNASVQGVQNLTAMAKKSPIKFGTVVCSITALGFMMPIIQAALYEAIGGDDDDYWNIPEYDRQNNLCIMIGGGKYVKMPLPIGFREMYAIGDMVAAMVFDKKFERDVEQIGLDMANKVASVVLPINPLESSANGLNIWASIGNTLAPSSAQFLIQNAMNVDWKGAPLQKEYTYNEDDPQWMKAFNNNPMWMKSLSKWCNENINLDGDYKGMDWSPEKLDNTLSNLGGGIYTVVKQFGQIISTAMDDEKKFSMSNVPLAGAVVGNGIDSDERFVTDAYFDMKDYYDGNLNYIKRVAKTFGYNEEDVFVKQKGKQNPKMAEIYQNDNFEFMKEWYKGNEKLEDVKNDIKKLEKEIASKKNPSDGRLRKLDRLNAEFETKRSEFVNKMLELE